MDERELTGLLYRADWTRLTLAGTVRGAGWSLDTTVSRGWRGWETGPRSRPFPLPDPPDWMTEAVREPPGAQRSLVLAPGRRYRVTSAGGRRVIGSDGERAWQWFADLPMGTEVRFDQRPAPPFPELLAPVWLLVGYRLTIGATTTVAGRAGIAVTGVARPGPRGGMVGSALLPWGLARRPARVSAVVDAELGILLRRELGSDDDADTDVEADVEADVIEFLTLDVGGPADLGLFAAPAGSFFGDGPNGGRPADRRPVHEAGQAALKLAGGLAAGGIGAAVRLAPKRRADPFAAATAEEPGDAMPDEEPLPGWALDGDGGGDGRTPVSAEVLDLLYRGGLDPVPFSGTLHEWTDGQVVVGALVGAVPESARRAGFGGVGFLIDTLTADDRMAEDTAHSVYDVRIGGWDRYRIDRVRLVPWPDSGRSRGRGRYGARWTVAGDGERTFTVSADQVRVRPGSGLGEGPHVDIVQLLDGSWLLAGRLWGGDVVDVDGRTGYRVIATVGTAPIPKPPLSWLPTWWLPAVAVIDASSGRLLRLTRYRDGKVATRLELRAVSDGGSDDFAFMPPEGLPIVTEPESRTPLDDFKEQLDAKIAGARGFLGSFLGGGDR